MPREGDDVELPYADAREWARDQSLANVPRLARLEAFAFQGHRDVVATFGAHGADLAARWAPPPSGTRRAGSALLGTLAVLAVASPVLGVAAYAAVDATVEQNPALPADVSTPITAVCFVVAAVVQVVLWVIWVRLRCTWEPMILGVAATTAVMATFATIAVPSIAARSGVPAQGFPAVVLTLVLAVGLVAGMLLRRRSVRRVPEDPGPPPRPTLSNRELARQAVAALPPEERDRIRTDRDEALRILAERGLLDDGELGRTLGADLGTLFALDPIRPG